MDWNKTKTIFIIVFLVLDLFLIYQFIEKKNSYKFDLLTETKFEDSLKENGIKADNVPREELSEKYIIAKSKVFKDSDFSALKNQKIINNGSSVYSSLKVPYKINDPGSKEEVEKFVREHIMFGTEYRYWQYNKEGSTINLSQTYKGKTLFMNQNGEIKLFLNKQKQIYAYNQTFLNNIEEFKEKEEVIPAIRAVETLFDKGKLEEKTEIKEAYLGYYTVVPVKTTQVLTPTWHIVLDNKKDFFVNALEGQIFQVTPDEKKME
ncbi:regulatory protein YycI of two-component signal transduction system YycFG [Peribacillus deserti]|uniref:Regulatory protein YycI of two-component signal transduction system YycFG n=1 Tax=Peribacillus deserti TaxID=673318 RepID=A0ABS2QK67_9BACI|nr:regulatory protein YycI of two-component signal transduction system YycFG [Peribacillus deserti]